MKPNKGQFKKGYDARRHILTPEERSKGFWNAIESIIRKYPNAIGKDGKHIAFHFLWARKNRQGVEDRS